MSERSSRLERLVARRRARADFRALWAGQTISLTGDAVAYVALPLFVAHLTGSALDLGLTAAAETAPTLLFGFAAGVLLDRFRLRPLLILADVFRAAVFFGLAWLVMTGRPGVAVVFGAAFLAGSAKIVFDSGLQALIPGVIPSEGLARANAALQISQSLTFPLGAALAGFLSVRVGFAGAFGFNGITFLLSAASLLAVRGVVARPRQARRRFTSELGEGLRYLWSDTRLRLMTLTGALANLVVAPLEITLVLLAERNMGLAPSEIGLLFAALGLGAVLGAAITPRVAFILGLGKTFVLGVTLLGLGFFMASFATGFATGASTVFVASFGISWIQVALITYRQATIPDWLLGRVTAASRTVAWASLPVGAALGGWVAEQIGVVRLFMFAPIPVVAIGLFLAFTEVWRVELRPSAVADDR